MFVFTEKSVLMFNEIKGSPIFKDFTKGTFSIKIKPKELVLDSTRELSFESENTFYLVDNTYYKLQESQYSLDLDSKTMTITDDNISNGTTFFGNIPKMNITINGSAEELIFGNFKRVSFDQTYFKLESVYEADFSTFKTEIIGYPGTIMKENTTSTVNPIVKLNYVELYNITEDGLVAYYPLTEDSLDYYLGNYDGIDHGDLAYDGLSASFDGDGDYIKLPNIKINSSRTFSCFIKGSINGLILRSTESTDEDNGSSWSISIYNGQLTTYWHKYKDGGYASGKTDKDIIPDDNNWHYIAIVNEKDNHHFYLDNNEIDFEFRDDDSEGICEKIDSIIEIGRREDDSNYITGNISKLRVYDRALNQAEINTIYNAEKVDFK